MNATRLVCSRCHRGLLNPPIIIAGMRLGPKCAAIITGEVRSKLIPFVNHSVPAPIEVDERQTNLFEEPTP